jgi:hypothetical protein
MGTREGDAQSAAYNDNIRLRTLQWAIIDTLQHPPPHFEDVGTH